MFSFGTNLKRWMLAALALVCAGCGGIFHPAPSETASPLLANTLNPRDVTARVSASPLNVPQTCSNTFVTHALDHTTNVHGNTVRQFETNGAGIAINDLDGDGKLDVVLANLNGAPSIFWNRGALHFEKQTLDDNNTRAVNIVDADGDGRQDIVFTHLASALSLWHNTGARDAAGQTLFSQQGIRGINRAAHSMAWADLNGDKVLDVVTGSYDAELGLQDTNNFLFGDGAGVIAYLRAGEKFVPTRLSKNAQALAIALIDLNEDGARDILVGNDFDTPDMLWLNENGTWKARKPFAVTSHHTMTYEWGDIDNNGTWEIFSTDMKSYDISISTLAEWLPMMARLARRVPKGDPQVDENVLQVRDAQGRYQNQAALRGIDSAGWAWSGKFGDLNQDGFLDLYVVNGMMDSQLFFYLPGDELVEENQAFRNLGDGNFAPAQEWNLNSTASGRGMSMADLDNDGDLDIVVNNLRSPAELFENQVCDGSALQVDLRWAKSTNPFAIGAQLQLQTSKGTFTRDVRAGSGYLSGDPSRVHFGIPKEATLQQMQIIWPDAHVSRLETLTPNTLMKITR